MTPRRANHVLALAILLLVIATFLSCTVTSMIRQVEPVGGELASAPRQLTAVDGYAPIATYDPSERVLTITDHLPAGALICIGGRCGLPSSWEQLAPEHWKVGP